MPEKFGRLRLLLKKHTVLGCKVSVSGTGVSSLDLHGGTKFLKAPEHFWEVGGDEHNRVPVNAAIYSIYSKF
jgi:hypothetical protein